MCAYLNIEVHGVCRTQQVGGPARVPYALLLRLGRVPFSASCAVSGAHGKTRYAHKPLPTFPAPYGSPTGLRSPVRAANSSSTSCAADHGSP